MAYTRTGFAASSPAARGIPQYGQAGYIGPETAFFGKYAATGGSKPGYERVIQHSQQYAGGGGAGLSSLLADFRQREEQARAANIKRYAELMKISERAIKRYQPGGAFEQRGLAEIERQKTKGVGQETQQLISSGLFGTTTMGGVGRRWEAEVGAPARGRLEDIMQQRVTEAERAKMGYIERRDDPYPDYGMIAQLAMQAGQAPRRQLPLYGAAGF